METKKNEYIRFDWAMKRLLRDKANFGVLEGLLTALLGTEIHILQILESQSNRMSQRDKSNTVDVKAQTEKGEIIVVEVQNLFQMDFLKRMLYGVGKAIVEQLSIGDPYKKIKKVYSIAIAYFDVGEGDDYLYHGRTNLIGVHSGTELKVSTDEKEAYESSIASDALPEYWLIRVNNFDKYARTPIGEWMQYLKTGYIADDTQVSGLVRAKEILQFDSMSREDQNDYLRYLNDLQCEKDSIRKAQNEGREEGLKKGREEGLKEGREEGRKEGIKKGKEEGQLKERKEIARKLKALGIDVKTISNSTMLSLDEIEGL